MLFQACPGEAQYAMVHRVGDVYIAAGAVNRGCGRNAAGTEQAAEIAAEFVDGNER